MKQFGRLVPMLKVSHHGKHRDRWKPTGHRPQDSVKGKIQEVLKNQQIEKRRKVNQSRAVKVSNTERARHRRHRQIIAAKFYVVFHSIPESPEVARAIASRKQKPVGLIVMSPRRTKHQATLVGHREEFSGVAFEVRRGMNLDGLAGYHPYVIDEGQAWVQQRTLDKQQAEGSREFHGSE